MYIELVCAARIIDLLIEANFAKAVQITVVLAIFIFLGGLLLDALSSIHTYKSDRAHRKMLRKPALCMEIQLPRLLATQKVQATPFLFCDRIILLSNGRIVEEGTHEQLLARKGKYASMYTIQASYYQEGDRDA